MSGHLWATRLAVAVCGVLLAACVGFAASWSAISPRPDAAPARHAVLAAASSSMFRDDFERDPVGAVPAGWTVVDGVWDGVVADGSHVVRHGVGPRSYGHLVTGSPAWTDYAVSARLRPGSLSTGFAGVAARYQGRGDYYACGVYYGTAVRLWRVRAGTMALLDARTADVAADRFHDVRLVVRGSRLSCVFDQTVVLTAVDASFVAGRIALVAGADEAAEFDDVVAGT